MPEVAITTDVIVGFPGETDEQFENGYRLIEDSGFAELHVFPYSKRTGTPAARMEDQVPEPVKQERVKADPSFPNAFPWNTPAGLSATCWT